MDSGFWKQIAKRIQATAEHQGTIDPSLCRPVSGGDINQAYLLGGSQGVFVKLNQSSRIQLFEAEANSLDRIARSETILTPKVIAYGVEADYAFLALAPLKFAAAGDMRLLGSQLAQMHQLGHTQFGFNQDNYIGLTPQPNRWTDDWVEFFSLQRIRFQIELLHAKGIGQISNRNVEALIDKIPEFFCAYEPQPSLVHGDLWQGNYSFTQSGQPVIFDPACYFADHEVDLAMLELFGSPGQDFYAAYHQVFPIDAGYQQRKPLYNLYHVLNHANLFGGGYIGQAERLIESLLASSFR